MKFAHNGHPWQGRGANLGIYLALSLERSGKVVPRCSFVENLRITYTKRVRQLMYERWGTPVWVQTDVSDGHLKLWRVSRYDGWTARRYTKHVLTKFDDEAVRQYLRELLGARYYTTDKYEVTDAALIVPLPTIAQTKQLARNADYIRGLYDHAQRT